MSNTPTPAVPPAEAAPLTSLHTSLLKSLRLAVNDPAAPGGAPTPDTGVEVPSTIEDFSERSGSLADKMRMIEKDVAAGVTVPPAEPVAVETPPAPEATTPAPVAPKAVIPPPPAPAAPAEPVAQRPVVKIPELPKPFLEDSAPVLPNPIDMSGLDEDEQEEVRTALFAERQYPDRYPGHARRVADYIRKHKQFVQQQEKEDPNATFDNTNQAYQRFLEANRPPVTNSERKRLDRERLLEEAAAHAERKMSAKTKKLEEEVVQLKAAPLVERTINDYKSLVKDLMPKEDDPIVVEAVDHMTRRALEAGHEFLLLASNLKPFDTKSETHKWLADFIQEQGDLYLKSGHESLKRGGRKFTQRSEYNRMTPEDRAKYFTFTDEDILQLIAVNAKAAAEFHSGNERKRLEKAGYTRTPSAPAAAPVASAPPTIPPSPPASPRASASVASPTPTIEPPKSNDPFLKFMAAR